MIIKFINFRRKVSNFFFSLASTTENLNHIFIQTSSLFFSTKKVTVKLNASIKIISFSLRFKCMRVCFEIQQNVLIFAIINSWTIFFLSLLFFSFSRFHLLERGFLPNDKLNIFLAKETTQRTSRERISKEQDIISGKYLKHRLIAFSLTNTSQFKNRHKCWVTETSFFRFMCDIFSLCCVSTDKLFLWWQWKKYKPPKHQHKIFTHIPTWRLYDFQWN